ncbi:MAG: apolipoprotein N-acyltransferase, partial [Candidatus Omnitrophica bacterium]|nr:apolipoprotein N-acyltransferase [Candidatus Omnitrophota bacterium]
LFYRRRPAGLLYVPALWVSSEYLRALLLDGFTWDPGYTQSFNLYTVQAAGIAGSYGITFLLIAFAFSVYCATKDNDLRYLAPVIVIPAALFMYGFFALADAKDEGPRLKISLLQGNVDQARQWDEKFAAEVLDRYAGLCREAALDRPDLIVWPETSMPGDFRDDADLREAIARLIIETGCPMMIGAPLVDNTRLYNTAMLIKARGTVTGLYKKIHLIPFSEYSFIRFPLPNILKRLLRYKEGSFSPGREPGIFSLSSGGGAGSKEAHMFGVTLCSEDFYAGLTRKLVDKCAGFVINMNNNAALGATSAQYLHLEASILRAVENGRPLAQCSNAGISCFISRHGNITACLKKNNKVMFIEGVVTYGLAPAARKTVYTGYGFLFPVFCLCIAFVIRAFKIRKEIR